MTPLLTALVDTYNHERYIEQAISSVLEQDFPPSEFEILVVDDGSTDNTPAIIQKFAPRVRHLRKKNGGQASAFNAGFAESRGQIIALLDGDDWWAKGKLSAVAAALEQSPDVAAVGHGHYKFFQKTGETQLCVPPSRSIVNLETPAAVRSWAFLLMGALTVRRRVLEWITPIPEDMIFMADSAIQAAATIMGALVLPEPLFYYRCHAENRYAVDPVDAERTRRRFQMAEIAYCGTYRHLLSRGILEESVSRLLGASCVDARRARLHHCGGRRMEAFRAEMDAFHQQFQNPALAQRLFKYLVVGPATLLFSPRKFYSVRDWYSTLR
jgi:glycosyltransferase involved in cell wall biosynthesis